MIAVNPRTVTVQLANEEACGQCAQREGCSLVKEGRRCLEIAADGFSIGDQVRVVVPAGSRLTVSAALYLIPTLLIVSGAFAGAVVGPAFFQISPDVGSFIGVVSGILISLAFVHFYPGGKSKNGQLRLEKIED